MANETRDKIYLAALRQEWPYLGWVPEHKFHPERKWRFDFAAPPAMVALEIEGGVWTRGRHSRGAGMIADMHKYNAAASRGWINAGSRPLIFAALLTLPQSSWLCRRVEG